MRTSQPLQSSLKRPALAVVLATLENTISSDLSECVTACRDGSAYCSKVKGTLIQLNHPVNSTTNC